MVLQQSFKNFHQTPEESDEQFEAFLLWVNHEPPLSCREFEQHTQKKFGQYATLSRWMKKFNWHQRRASYAISIKSEVQKAVNAGAMNAKIEAGIAAVYDNELEAYRKRVVESAELLRRVGVQILDRVRDNLEQLDSGGTVPSSSSTAARAAASLIQTSDDATAIILGIDDILGSIVRGARESVDSE